MVQYQEQALFEGIPREVLIKAIEVISEGLVEDARISYGGEWGFYHKVHSDPEKGKIATELKFVPYKYRFEWAVEKEGNGYLVTLTGKTPGSWYEFLLDTHRKIREVVDTQWIALLNFSVGFASGVYYVKEGETEVKEKIKKAKEKVTRR